MNIAIGTCEETHTPNWNDLELEALVLQFVLSGSEARNQLVEAAFHDCEERYSLSREVEMYRSLIESFEAK